MGGKTRKPARAEDELLKISMSAKGGGKKKISIK